MHFQRIDPYIIFLGVGVADPVQAWLGAQLEHGPGLPGPRVAQALPAPGCGHEEAPEDDRVHHLLRQSGLPLHLQASQPPCGLRHPLQPPGVCQKKWLQQPGD